MDLHRMNYLCDLIRHIDIGITSMALFIQTFQTYRIIGILHLRIILCGITVQFNILTQWLTYNIWVPT